MPEQNSKSKNKIKQGYIGALVALAIGVVFYLMTKHIILLPLCALAGFFLYDRPLYLKCKEEQKAKEEEQKALEQQAIAEQFIKEQKKAASKMRSTQKKNRGKKSALYENIYTVAGYVLATQTDLEPYIKKAEDVIRYFKASKEDRAIAVEAFNRALDPNFDVETYVYNYLMNIGKNREYISYVLTYAFIISSKDDLINDDSRQRLYDIGKSLGSSKAALNRLFKTGCAEAKFAQVYEDYHKSTEANGFSQENTSQSQSSQDSTNQKTNENTNNQNSQSSSSQRAFENSQGRTAEALEILGVDSSCTYDDVRRAHKKLMLKYHPDRLASQGLPEDMVAIFTEKAKAVQVAFDYLKKIYSDYA